MLVYWWRTVLMRHWKADWSLKNQNPVSCPLVSIHQTEEPAWNSYSCTWAVCTIPNFLFIVWAAGLSTHEKVFWKPSETLATQNKKKKWSRKVFKARKYAPTEKSLWFTVQGPQKTQTSWHLNCQAGLHSNSLHINACRNECSIKGTIEKWTDWDACGDSLQGPWTQQGTDSSLHELPPGWTPAGGFWHSLLFFTRSLRFGTSSVISWNCFLQGKTQEPSMTYLHFVPHSSQSK